MGKSNLSAFGSFSKKAASKAQAEHAADSNDMFTPKEGKNRIRILPPPAGIEDPFRKVFVHYLEVKGSDKNIGIVCPAKTKVRNEEGELEKSGLRCAICEENAELESTGNPMDKDYAYKRRAQPRIYANVIDRTDPTCTPKPYGMPPTIHKELLAFREGTDDEDDPGVDFTDPFEGYDVIIIREGNGKETKYPTKKLARNPSPIVSDDEGNPDEEEIQLVAEAMTNLDKFAALPTNEAIAAALQGKNPRELASGDDDDDDEDLRPRKRLGSGQKASKESTAKRAKRRKPKEEDIIDADFDDEDEDDDQLPPGM